MAGIRHTYIHTHTIDMIIKLFKKIGLKTNKNKIKYMMIRGRPAPRARCFPMKMMVFSAQNGDKKTYCNICLKTMKKGSLQRHMEQKHKMKPEEYPYRKRRAPTTFLIDFKKDLHNKCPVPDCGGGSNTKYRIHRHFCFFHPDSEVALPEGGQLPKCKLCGMHTKNIDQYQQKETYIKGQRRRKD